jgi:hypothetical protein
MATCDVCRNDYDRAFSIKQAEKTTTFKSFECAIHVMAPRSAHGVEDGGTIHYFAHCAQDRASVGLPTGRLNAAVHRRRAQRAQTVCDVRPAQSLLGGNDAAWSVVAR